MNILYAFLKKVLLAFVLSFSLISIASALQPLTVILDWFPNPDHAPLILAKELGYFREQGLNVNLIGPADPADPPKWVAAKKADIAITYQPEFMEYVDQGLPLIHVGTLIDKPLDCLIALKESGVRTLTDFKGKRIGSGSNGLSSILLKVMLAKAGLAPNDVELINVRYNLTQALLTKNVDAVSGMMRNVEVPQLTLSGHSIVTFFPEDYGIPSYSVLIFISHLDQQQDPRFSSFFKALNKAVHYLNQHPQESWQLFTQKYPEANNAVNRAAWFATIPTFAKDTQHFDQKKWAVFARFMHQYKMIKIIQPSSRYTATLK